MADYDSSLPVRSELLNSTGADQQVSIADGTTATQLWEIDANNIGQVNLNDGTNSLIVNADGSLPIEPIVGSKIIITDGTDDLDINSSGTIGIGDGTNDWVFNSNGAGKTTIEDDNGDQLGVNTDGSINVNVVETTTGGEVHEYGTSVAVAAGATATVVDYTVTVATTLVLAGWQASASGKAKAVLSVGPAASEVDQAVRFISTSNGGFNETLPHEIEVVAGDKVLVVMTNTEPGQPQDLYAWINGREV